MPGVALAPSHNSCSLQMKPFATAAHGTGSPLYDNESSGTMATHTHWNDDLTNKSANATASNVASMPNKPIDFQIRIHIIEARKLEGEFVRALVKVAVGNVVKETSTKCGTNNPFWDETLVYNFKEHPQLLMDKAVKFKVLNTRKILKDAVIGSFEFDVGLAYSEPDHCFIHKWLLLTEPHDSTGKPKGFLKISINVLGPGMDATPSPSICSPDNVDIESNLLRPSGAQIQPATLHVRIFEAADLPQMDPAYFNKFKKLFNSQATPKDLVDPYVTLSIAGHHGKTKVIWNDQDPQWNHQLNMAIRFPLFSERIRFQLKDKDQTTTDDLIGTYFMKLSQISPNDLPPTFGPCYINFYGSPREFSDLGDAYEYLNEGVLEGVAYRGRLLVEVTTSVGVLPKEKHEEIKPQYIRAAKPFLKKRKYKLCCAFLGASMIEPFEDTVQFEVSIGNCGNKLDESVCSQMSSTPPLKPMWDGNEYYFLPWMDKKPVVMVDSEWEDCNHRIETANMLENITESLETQLAALKQHAGKKRFEHNLNAFLKSACSELEEAVNWLRPTKPLTESLNPSNALDNLLLDHRHCQLLSAIKELGTIGDSLALVRRKGTAAKVTRNHADYIMECTNIITMIRQLAIEPQNSIPDVIFWMLCDNKRVAYHRIPSHHLMYATRPEGRGRMCGRVQTFFLKPPSLAKEEDLEGAVGRAQMQVVVWLGKEEEHRVWSQNMPGGELAVFAEAVSVTLVSMGKGNLEGGDVDVEGGKGEGGRMEGTASTVQMSSFGPYQYENQTIVGGIWNSTLMLDWPSWSDVTGKISQPLEAFTPPQGWAWAQDWVISPDVSMPLDPDDGKMEWKEESFEIQERFIGGLWQEEASFWTMLVGGELIQSMDGEGVAYTVTKDDFECPLGWAWSGAWLVDNTKGDPEGWEYSTHTRASQWVSSERTNHRARRRRWTRTRILVSDIAVQEERRKQFADMIRDGWEYSSSKRGPFHMRKSYLDFFRRRRYLRRMTSDDPTALATDKLNFGGSVLLGRGLVLLGHGLVLLGRGLVLLGRGLVLLGCGLVLFGCILRLSGLALEEVRLAWSPEHFSKSFRNPHHKGQKLFPRLYLSFKDEECHQYQLRGYIYQARDMHGISSSGFSDPYCVVSVGSKSTRTVVVKNTVTPVWDETILLDVRIYGNPEAIQAAPPLVTLQFRNKNPMTDDDHLGWAFCKPLVRLKQNAPPPELEWTEISRLRKRAGDALVTFELLLNNGSLQTDLPPGPPPKRYSIPDHIKPEVKPSRIELLCWGVRDMKRFCLMAVNSPCVELECGGASVRSNCISDASVNPNFPGPRPFITLDQNIPVKDKYAPPLNITLYDKRGFNQIVRVGVHSIKSLHDYYMDPAPSRFQTSAVRATTSCVELSIENNTDTFIPFEEVDPDVQKNGKYDWWTKYYCSISDTVRMQGSYIDEGYDLITVYEHELEKEFNYFEDLLKTFPLYRGNRSRDSGQPEEDSDQPIGYLKGYLKVYPSIAARALRLPLIPPPDPITCIVRVYVIKGTDLQAQDVGGKSDPYLKLTFGKTVIDDRDSYIPNQLNPIFGKVYEVKTTIPLDYKLTITVMDYDHFTADDLIGYTTIDLENRLLSRHRATCGLPESFSKRGPNIWRDNELPTQILDKFCKTHQLSIPQWNGDREVFIDDRIFNLDTYEENLKPNPHLGAEKERLALHILRNVEWDQGWSLVPEHIEKRTLYNPSQPGISQGMLHMWVDIFPQNAGLIPPPVNISVRKSEKFYLRVVVWNTYDVELDETSVVTGEDMSDIYVKGWMQGQDKTQKTDVHYRSMNGEGNFNWRFIFDFDYICSECMMVIKRKEHFYSLDKTESFVPPRLTLQVWDNDLISPDDFIGTVDFNLNNMPKPATSSTSCSLKQLPDMASSEDNKMMNLFEKKRAKGFWPVYSRRADGPELTGKLELEIELLTEDEHKMKPSGVGRDEPNENPFLPPPNRPPTSFLWITSPLKTCQFIIWKRYKWPIISVVVVMFLVLFLVIGIFAFPGELVNFFTTLTKHLLPDS
ncbi:hypothetical protein EMCRGX_G026978 [Ephydatia muelleri]